MTPNFKTMTVTELRTYVLEHREDETAFHAFVDRLTENGTDEIYPYPNTPETAAMLTEAIRKRLGK
jgi:dihydrodipicolinate synthase/N-acetylneuraminate lyase